MKGLSQIRNSVNPKIHSDPAMFCKQTDEGKDTKKNNRLFFYKAITQCSISAVKNLKQVKDYQNL